jgi:HD-GYP domain-containing protein (c-di-GMP phosphodiesterase class II)
MKYPHVRDAGSTSASEKALLKLIRAISSVSKEAEPELFAHVQPHAHATAQLARHFAIACRCNGGNSGPTPGEIELGAYLHDIGKYFIATSILLKPDALDEEERAVMSLHSIYGANIVSKLPGSTEAIRRVVLHHHEHWDGNGYPEGLSGTAIPLAARIISIIDVYTSLRAKRSYKSTLTKQQAFKTLIEMAGRELDPYLLEDFLKLVRDKQLPTKRIRMFISGA